jgi:hypothetical protein
MLEYRPLTSYFQRVEPAPAIEHEIVQDKAELSEHTDPDYNLSSAIEKLKSLTAFHRNAILEKQDQRTKFECIRQLCVLRFLQKIKECPRSRVQSSTEVAKAFFGNQKGSAYKAQCIRIWANEFVRTGSMMPYRQGVHQKKDSLIDDPDVRQALLSILRSHRPETIEARSFSKWISETLHSNEDLCILQPVNISERTARRWLHLLGYRQQERKKGTYTDGHERPDVVAYRKK